MSDKTGISWTDATWNPVRGCSRVSEGCRNCYAESIAARFCGPGQPYEGLARRVLKTEGASQPRWTGVVRLVPEHLADPIRWKRPRRIFTNSMSDLFHEGLAVHDIDRVVAVMIICATREGSNHTFQTLTKRAGRMRAYFTDEGTQERVARAAGAMMEDGDGWFDDIAFRKEGLSHPNLWWGVSVENQEAADERIPELLETPAAVRFLSCEPLLGPVDISEYFDPCSVPCGEEPWPDLDWVIAGCESGHGARACDVEWLRSLRDQCEEARCAFFLKQGAETDDGLVTEGPDEPGGYPQIWCGEGSRRKPRGVIELPYLDGVQWAQFPKESTR